MDAETTNAMFIQAKTINQSISKARSAAKRKAENIITNSKRPSNNLICKFSDHENRSTVDAERKDCQSSHATEAKSQINSII